MNPARLAGVRVYLAGDLTPWRPPAADLITSLGGLPVDPLAIAANAPGPVQSRLDARAARDWAAYAGIMREVRSADLDLVRSCGLLIAYLESDVPLCGTFEELFLAAQLGMPCYVVARKDRVLPWIFGVVPPVRKADDVAGLAALLA
jgi:hypothetical protein